MLPCRRPACCVMWPLPACRTPRYPSSRGPASVAPSSTSTVSASAVLPHTRTAAPPLPACRPDSSAPPPAGPWLWPCTHASARSTPAPAPRFARESREERPRRDWRDGGADGDHDHRARIYACSQDESREEREAVGREPVNPSSTGASACSKVIASAISPPRVLRTSNWAWRRVEARDAFTKAKHTRIGQIVSRRCRPRPANLMVRDQFRMIQRIYMHMHIHKKYCIIYKMSRVPLSCVSGRPPQPCQRGGKSSALPRLVTS